MADTKISALPSASTPLAGTEVLPIVQSGATKKVSVTDLTSGRSVDASSFSSIGQSVFATSSGAVGIGTSSPSALAANYKTLDIRGSVGGALRFGNATDSAYAYSDSNELNIATATNKRLILSINGTEQFEISTAGNIKATTGNFVQGTASKGVNFTANSAAAGMTSQLLNWYEEGTWTPGQGAGLTVVGTFSSSGTYTRIGRQVTVTGRLQGSTSVATTAASAMTTGLPFTVGKISNGAAVNNAYDTSTVIIADGGSTSIYSVGVILATSNIWFSVTYIV